MAFLMVLRLALPQQLPRRPYTTSDVPSCNCRVTPCGAAPSLLNCKDPTFQPFKIHARVTRRLPTTTSVKKLTCARCSTMENNVKLLILWQLQQAPYLVLKLLGSVLAWLHLHFVRSAIERDPHIRSHHLGSRCLRDNWSPISQILLAESALRLLTARANIVRTCLAYAGA